MKMPIGFRFHPTDEELVVHYLKRKALSLPLPASVISEFDVLGTHPWSLPGEVNEKRYFFSSRGRDGGGSGGYWKPIGKEKPIVETGSNEVVGMRRALIFCGRKPSNHTNTRWFLHQYRLLHFNSTQMVKREMDGDWLVFQVFQRKRKARKHAAKMATCIDFTAEDCPVFYPPPQPTSPSSSEITEVSPNGLDEEESSSFITSCIRN
ncbi:hypothetical protein Golob_002429 [Gossypium lobatum]|uniref:NAC domain-containing protein n=1 Tax=Gossypium lobatum TaxID=34289 RepID=A0A7J8N586_9ROSI|nr:hypothetical protein [Gossypium lobatum]